MTIRSSVATVSEYLDSLPPERRDALQQVRKVILEHLPDGYREGINWGMIVYEVPLERCPNTYNGQPLGYVALASQKHYMSLYLMWVYGDKGTEEWFKERYKASGKKLNMGKSCVRFKRVDDLPLDLIGETVALVPIEKFIEHYQQSRKK